MHVYLLWQFHQLACLNGHSPKANDKDGQYLCIETPTPHSINPSHFDDICRHIILRYYRPDLDLVLECDASKVAMGMLLMQNFSQKSGSFGTELIDARFLKLLVFVSKIPIPTKQYYASNERERCLLSSLALRNSNTTTWVIIAWS